MPAPPRALHLAGHCAVAGVPLVLPAVPVSMDPYPAAPQFTVRLVPPPPRYAIRLPPRRVTMCSHPPGGRRPANAAGLLSVYPVRPCDRLHPASRVHCAVSYHPGLRAYPTSRSAVLAGPHARSRRPLKPLKPPSGVVCVGTPPSYPEGVPALPRPGGRAPACGFTGERPRGRTATGLTSPPPPDLASTALLAGEVDCLRARSARSARPIFRTTCAELTRRSPLNPQ